MPAQGFLPGWWLGEPDNRADEPYMSPGKWTSRLLEAGFSSPEAVVLDAEPPYQVNATIVARPAAPAKLITPTPTTTATAKQHVTLLCDKAIAAATSDLLDLLQASGYEASHASLGEHTPPPRGIVVSLLDLSPTSGSGSFFASPSADTLSALHALLSSLKAAGRPLLWLTRACQIRPPDPSYAHVLGVARTARQELGVRFATLELDESLNPKEIARALDLLLPKLLPLVPRDGPVDEDMEFVYSSSTHEILTPRASWLSVPDALALRSPDKPTIKALQISRPGHLDTLTWTLRPQPASPLGAHAVEVRIHSAGLNFKDVLVAMGVESVLDDDSGATPPLGVEASGVVTAVGPGVTRVREGDRVMLFAPRAGCFSASVRVAETLCARIPPGTSLAAAAGMPCVFATVVRALLHKADLQPNQTILVHSAAGGVGLAAVQLARHLGACVLATAGTPAKRAFLRDAAGIDPSRIFSSRDGDDFVAGVMRATAGRGADVVLSSLPGELLRASWRCVAPGGTLVDIGKRERGTKMCLEPLDDNRAFVGIDLSRLAGRDVARLLDEVVDLHRRGAIAPIEPSQTFPCSDVAGAFRCLAKGTQVGKIVVDFADEHLLVPAPQPPPDPTFRPDRVYVIAGGIAGLGASIARWLAHHGARNLAILSRSAGRSAHDAAILAELRGAGCAVRAYACDVTDEAGVRAVLAGISRSHRIGGVVHLAMVLADVELSRLTPREWHAAAGPKVGGTWNLHRALDALDGGEDFFVLVGSMFGVTGRAGQANYAAANAFLDSFAQYRRGLGLPCSVLDVGPVEDVGTLARKRELRGAMGSAGARFLTEQDVLDGLQLAIARSRADDDDDDVAAGDGRPFRSEAQLGIGFRCTLPLDHPQNSVVWKRDPRMVFYSHVDDQDDRDRGGRDAAAGTSSMLSDFVSRVRDAPAELDATASATFLGREIARRVLTSLMMADDDGSRADASVSMSLASLGMDSLMTIEVRNWWRSVFGVDVSLLQLTSAPNFEHLGKLAARQMKERFGGNGTG